MTVFVHYFLLGGIAFGEAEYLVLSWWWLYCCYTEYITVAGLLLFSNSSCVF
jgi:hypothetical protein